MGAARTTSIAQRATDVPVPWRAKLRYTGSGGLLADRASARERGIAPGVVHCRAWLVAHHAPRGPGATPMSTTTMKPIFGRRQGPLAIS
jgi:hypothetical protein